MRIEITFHHKPQRIITCVNDVRYFCETPSKVLPCVIHVDYDARSIDGSSVIPVSETFETADIYCFAVR